MACKVYREGKGDVEFGIECESTTCEIEELGSLLAAGWLQSPPGYVAPEPVSVEEQDLDSTITPRDSSSYDQQPEVDALNEEIDGLRKELDLRISIEENLNATIEQLNGDLSTARQIEDRLNAELSKLRKSAEPAGDELDPVRAAGRDAGIEGWETMHLSSLKKALKDQEA